MNESVGRKVLCLNDIKFDVILLSWMKNDDRNKLGQTIQILEWNFTPINGRLDVSLYISYFFFVPCHSQRHFRHTCDWCDLINVNWLLFRVLVYLMHIANIISRNTIKSSLSSLLAYNKPATINHWIYLRLVVDKECQRSEWCLRIVYNAIFIFR